MFDHVELRATDMAASGTFYDLVLATLGLARTYEDDRLIEWSGEFGIARADAEHPPTRRLHIGFAAPSREHVDAFWRAGVEAGHPDDGAPGERPEYSPDYYGAFLLDPAGNSAEAVHGGHMRTTGAIDHLWIRVANVAAARRFYETAAPHAGLRLGTDTPERVQFRGHDVTFSLLESDAPTEHVHIAFPATENATVDAFHRALTQAGHRDNGPPGERPRYHPGYYGAFVLDPDGNNIEVVNHNR
jgi:catechol 2,3-dioxygenase-like lactoylglutathione lyase family enzyme